VIRGVSAGFGRRFAALVYDALLLTAVLMVITFVPVIITNKPILHETLGAWAYVYRAVLGAAIAGYYMLNWTRSGQTLGMRAWRLRAVSDEGTRMSWRAAALRFAWGVVAWTPAALGVLWLYLDSEHLALHDRLSRTRVLRLSRA
jgi:uncharacterized RDD family membrane protein YckC